MEFWEYFCFNFWLNMLDILVYELMNVGLFIFVKCFMLVVILFFNYGMYGLFYEFMEYSFNINGKEEYLNFEKYEICYYDWNYCNCFIELIIKVNYICKEQLALQDIWNIYFICIDNELLMSYVKFIEDKSNIIWCVVNFDIDYC